MKKLLVISASNGQIDDNNLYLDVKFVEGMKFYCRFWEGAVTCLIPKNPNAIPFGNYFNPEQLPFSVEFYEDITKVDLSRISQFDVILCDGDSHNYLNLAEIISPKPNKIFYVIEYTLYTRIKIRLLENSNNLAKLLYAIFWILNQERKRRRAFKLAYGLQTNGFPAFHMYKSFNDNVMLYLDNRISEMLLQSDVKLLKKLKLIIEKKCIHFLISGRLEPMKGAQDIIPLANYLHQKNVDFRLDIFGTGSLEAQIRKEIISLQLGNNVFLHRPVDFETELVPFAKTEADIFLSLNRQSDPSCTYIESMGCGLPILGYSNEMWRRLLKESDAGWMAPVGNWKALAKLAINIIEDRHDIVLKSRNALDYAREHYFEEEFVKRIEHLKT